MRLEWIYQLIPIEASLCLLILSLNPLILNTLGLSLLSLSRRLLTRSLSLRSPTLLSLLLLSLCSLSILTLTFLSLLSRSLSLLSISLLSTPSALSFSASVDRHHFGCPRIFMFFDEISPFQLPRFPGGIVFLISFMDFVCLFSDFSLFWIIFSHMTVCPQHTPS